MSTIGMNKGLSLFNWEAFANIPDKKFVYIKWIKNTCDKLIDMIDPNQEMIFPVNFFENSNSPHSRKQIHQFVKHNRSLYRDKLEQILNTNVGGMVFTFDWYFMFRDIVEIANDKGIVTILIPHEGVFSSEERYYTDREYGYNMPSCQYCFLWGELQKRIFIKRGHSGDGLEVVGAPKMEAIKPNKLRHSNANNTILLVLQNMDCQNEQEKALQFQNNVIEYLCQYALMTNKQLIIRNPPNNVNMIPKATLLRFEKANNNISFYNNDDPLEAISKACVVVSVNSTMLLEAKLSGKNAISITCDHVKSLWGEYGIETVGTIKQLEEKLDTSNFCSENTLSESLISDFGLRLSSPTERIRKYLTGYVCEYNCNNND